MPAKKVNISDRRAKLLVQDIISEVEAAGGYINPKVAVREKQVTFRCSGKARKGK